MVKKRTPSPAGFDPDAFLQANADKLHNRKPGQQLAIPDEALAVIRRANERREAGEDIQLLPLCRLLIEQFKIPTRHPSSLAARIKQLVGRSSW